MRPKPRAISTLNHVSSTGVDGASCDNQSMNQAVAPAGLATCGAAGAVAASLGTAAVGLEFDGALVEPVSVVPLTDAVLPEAGPLDAIAAKCDAPLRAVPKSTPFTKVWPLVMTMRPGSLVVCTQPLGTTSRTRNRPVSRPSKTVKL